MRACIVCCSEGPFPELYRREPWRMVSCERCGLVFQDPSPDEDVLARAYYHDDQFARMLLGPLRETTLRRARHHQRLLERIDVAPPGRLLDVGCASGAFLELAGEAGWEAVGVELGDAVSAAARERGLDVRTGTLAGVAGELEPEAFDLVSFWDVLEHLGDPREELELASGLLRPGGVLAATMPNVGGWYPRVTHRLLARRTGRWEYPELPVHLYDFSAETVRRLLTGAGFEDPIVLTFGTPFSFYRSTSLSRDALGGGARALVLRAAFEALRLAVYPAARVADRGNALFVAARRP